MEYIEFNTEEKQTKCIEALEKSGRDVFPLVIYIDDKRIGGFLVYYTTKGVSSTKLHAPVNENL